MTDLLYLGELLHDEVIPPRRHEWITDPIAEGRYRDYLLEEIAKATDPQQTLDLINSTLIKFAHICASYLPSFPETDEDTPSFRVPLVDTLRSVGELVEKMREPFYASALLPLKIFEWLRIDLHNNQAVIKNAPPPTEYKGSAPDLITDYLKNTPLLDFFDIQLPLSLPDETRFAGHWIIAPPGRGKTNLLHHLFFEDLKKDASIIVMDSKGDLVPPLSRLAKLQDRLIVIEPSEEHPLAINPLDIPQSSVAHSIALFEYVFSSLLEAKLTALQSTLFRNVLPAIVQCVPNPTMRVFRDIIENGVGRYANYFGNLSPLARTFFEQQFNSKTYTDTRNQLVWRLDFLMTNPLIRAMFEAPKTKLDIGKEMDAGKIILINNSKDLLTDDGAEFFGRFFIALILSAAQRRSQRRQQDKLPCYVYIDECHTVVHRDPKIATILDECRAQKIALILAHQRTNQITDKNVLDAMMNCAIRMANSDDEAKYLSDNFRTSPDFLRSLPIGSFATYIRDFTPQALALSVPYRDLDALPQLTDAQQEALMARMHALYAFEPERAPPRHTEPESAPQRPRAAPTSKQPAARADDHTKPATDW